MGALESLRRRLRQRFRHRLHMPGSDSLLVHAFLGYRNAPGGILDILGGVRLEYSPASVIGNQLFTQGAFEDLEIEFFRRLLSCVRHPVILDVGANIGVHSIRWARELDSPAIFAFEPSRDTAELLGRNVTRNGVADRVEVVRAAVSRHCGIAEFHHCEDDAYSSLRDTQRKRVVDTYPVAVTTIDAFAKERKLSRLDLVKVDVEGLEGEVLEGGRETLRALRPHLFVEIFGGTHSNPDPEATVRFACSLGYEPFILKDGRASRYSAHSDSAYNYYFRPAR